MPTFNEDAVIELARALARHAAREAFATAAAADISTDVHYLKLDEGSGRMARQTQFIVQAFIGGRGTSLKAEQAVRFKTAEEATKRAANLARSKLGVVAYSTSGDAELGNYDETPTILFRAGRLPPAFEE